MDGVEVGNHDDLELVKNLPMWQIDFPLAGSFVFSFYLFHGLPVNSESTS